MLPPSISNDCSPHMRNRGPNGIQERTLDDIPARRLSDALLAGEFRVTSFTVRSSTKL